MNSQQAKQLLEVYRPGSADEADPRFGEALAQAGRDPELARWFEAQRRFDRQMEDGLKTVSAPSDLKDTILASRKIVRLGFWQQWRPQAAAAAVIAALAIASGVMAMNRPTQFPKFRAELIQQAWNDNAHLEFESSDFLRIRQWLARQNIVTDFNLPEALHEANVVGCRIVETDGHRVPMLCLLDGGKHMHLFVLDGVQLAKLPPENSPDFEKCGGWKTASWQNGEKTYVLSGLKNQSFINKFRKAGRWAMSG